MTRRLFLRRYATSWLAQEGLRWLASGRMRAWLCSTCSSLPSIPEALSLRLLSRSHRCLRPPGQPSTHAAQTASLMAVAATCRYWVALQSVCGMQAAVSAS